MNRPTVVTVFGILNIVFGVFGIFGIAASMLVLLAVGTQSQNPMVQILQDNPGYAAYMKFSVVLGLLVSGALVGRASGC